MGNEKETSGKRGARAEKPTQVPKEGWKDIGSRVTGELTSDHISIVSAGVAFYFFLALFPALLALISIYGLIVDPAEVEQQMNQIAGILPEQASQM
ncbi:MAG: YhjD/YihY/BrkB family envelope integrity protein, partial [Balneolales bacterium]